MRSARRALWFPAVAALACSAASLGCEEPRKAAPRARAEDEAPVLVGVYPEKFQCESLISDTAMTELLGAPARKVESAASAPSGVASPCNYLATVAGQPSPIAWTFDIDCRDNMKQQAEALFAQYERTSSELVAAAMAQPASATAPVDGGAPKPRRAPELSREVDVGARGIDHHGTGLLFVDDDAPCYVRVVGPDADKRLALAKHLVSALTPATAPMSPRPLRAASPQ